jgi:hypothetical protein
MRPSNRGGGPFDSAFFDPELFDTGRLVFISHNKADKPVAERLGLYLVAEDIGVWYDSWEVSAGDSLVGRIDEALSVCTHFILIWSEQANTSKWVRDELEAALYSRIEAGRPRLITVVLDAAPLPALLARLVYLRLSDDPADQRKEIISAVTGNAPELAFVEALVGLFGEVIYPDGDDHFVYCPKCGSDDLVSWGEADDPHEMGGPEFTRCKSCGYQNLTDYH